MACTEFLEIEHKFVLPQNWQPDAFFASLRELGPLSESCVETTDTYMMVDQSPTCIYRHRIDHEIQHLTLKSLIDADPEVRTEVNLKLDQRYGNQFSAVKAFLEPLGISWQGQLSKQVHVFYFDDCEVVYYRARTKDRQIVCVEFEATKAKTIEQGLMVLRSYEHRCGFADLQRSEKSLFEWLFYEDLPQALKKRLIDIRS